MLKLKKLLYLLSLTLLVSTALFISPHMVLADAKSDACAGVALTGGSCDKTNAETQVNNAVAVAVNILSLVVGITAVIMVIVGGFKYITSSGDSNSVNSAKNTILYALVGLVIVALAQVIVKFVLNRVQK